MCIRDSCDPEGTVTVRLRQIGRTRKRARLEVSNTYKDGKAVDYNKFFERFYRIEESHNNREHKGFGIGPVSYTHLLFLLFWLF